MMTTELVENYMEVINGPIEYRLGLALFLAICISIWFYPIFKKNLPKKEIK